MLPVAAKPAARSPRQVGGDGQLLEENADTSSRKRQRQNTATEPCWSTKQGKTEKHVAHADTCGATLPLALRIGAKRVRVPVQAFQAGPASSKLRGDEVAQQP